MARPCVAREYADVDSEARENLALIRRIALTRLQHDHTKLGIQSKRIKAGWDERYLAQLLFEAPNIAPQKNASKKSNIRKT